MRCHGNHMVVVLLLLFMPIYLISCSGNATTSLPSGNNTTASKVGPPEQPAALTAIGADSHVDLRWQPPDGATSYNLYWSLATGGVTSASNVVLNVSMPFAHGELMNGSTYYYRVSALNIYGESPLSGEVQATPMLPFTKILAKLTDPDMEIADRFGYSVAVDGNYAIVGAPMSSDLDPGNPVPYSGAAYIFHRTGTGQWDPAGAKLTALDAQPYDWFGYKVSISGDYAIVGALYGDGGPGDPLTPGAAYIFHRIGDNTWDTGTKILGPVPSEYARFGSAVSISGDYAVVGQDRDSRAYVFRRTGENTWDGGVLLPIPPETEEGDRFGYAVAISGDHVIVGAFNEDGDAGNTLPVAGAAYIYRRTGVNAWDQFSKIMPYDGEAGDSFGISVAISGDYAAVGANRKGNDTGAVYIFHRSEENFWDEGPKVMAPDAQESDNFGWSVAMTDKYLLVGAFLEDCGWDNNNGEGSAYLYERIGTNTWDSGTKITIPAGDEADQFGYAVAISGESAIIGAVGDDGNTNELSEAGAAYLY